MEALKALLEKKISEVLPHLDFDKVDDIISFLISKGVKKEQDLRRISVSMLESHLDLIDSSDLYESWQKAYGIMAVSSSSTSVAGTSAAGPSCSSSSSDGNRRSVENLRKSVERTPTMPVFTVDSPYISSSVREAIRLKKRASVKGREETVQRIVDHCRETVPGLDRAMFDTVAQQLVTSFPDTFKDTISIGDCNYASLAKQLKVKYDNDKRPKSATRAEVSAPARKEAYGCLNWNPDLPLEATPESLEALCQELAAMHKFSEREWDWKIIKQKMEASYYLQRKDINESVEQCKSRKRKRQSLEDEDEDDPERQTVSNIKARWPFLFSPKGMNIHFKCLTGINFREALSKFIQEDCSDIIEAMANKGDDLAKIRRQMVRAETNGHTSVKFPTAIKMLTCALKDDMSRLVQFVERTTSFDEVKDVANFPANEGTPLLIAAGTNLYDCQKFFLCIDETPIATCTNLSDAFGMLFCSYFVLNLEYADLVSSLMTYIQRCVANINQKGGKCKTALLTRRSNDRVLKLQNKINDYRQLLEDEN